MLEAIFFAIFLFFKDLAYHLSNLYLLSQPNFFGNGSLKIQVLGMGNTNVNTKVNTELNQVLF